MALQCKIINKENQMHNKTKQWMDKYHTLSYKVCHLVMQTVCARVNNDNKPHSKPTVCCILSLTLHRADPNAAGDNVTSKLI